MIKKKFIIIHNTIFPFSKMRKIKMDCPPRSQKTPSLYASLCRVHIKRNDSTLYWCSKKKLCWSLTRPIRGKGVWVYSASNGRLCSFTHTRLTWTKWVYEYNFIMMKPHLQGRNQGGQTRAATHPPKMKELLSILPHLTLAQPMIA